MVGSLAHGLGFGVASDTDPRALKAIVATVSRLGYRSFWVNTGDGERADGLGVLRDAHAVAPELALGVGVIALHRVSPPEIVRRVVASELPLERLYLGIGSGTAPTPVERPVARVRDAVAAIRAGLPGARLVVGALGPAMCRLGGELADCVLLNWMPPGSIQWARGEIDRGRVAGGRPAPGPAVLAYVRVATGTDGATRISTEAERYRGAGKHYEENAARAGSWAGGVDLDSSTATVDLRSYGNVVDGLIVRALPATASAADLEAIAAGAMRAFGRKRGSGG